jgi:hypothetical protein
MRSEDRIIIYISNIIFNKLFFYKIIFIKKIAFRIFGEENNKGVLW